MLLVEIKPLLKRLNPYATTALEGAAGFCVNRQHYEITIEHWLMKMLENPQSDIPLILKHVEIELSDLKRALNDNLGVLSSGNTARPAISPVLFDLVQDAWLIASVDFQHSRIRSGILLLALLVRFKYLSNANYQHIFKHINRETLAHELTKITANSIEANVSREVGGSEGTGETAVRGEGQAIAQYCEDITAKAKSGKIDPVFGRDNEIRQMVDVLVRRRKNNPILVGEPGVGKTAVVEGLALRITQGDVPDRLKNVTLLSLDIALLEAGASMKGEFEDRLKSVIDEVKSSEKPIILFIDEAHMLVGAGGASGGSDAANILKPALARGELRTIAATTWAEYKKYFEKDAALERRFLPIKLDEPSVESTVLILRGLKANYEKAHGVVIRDDALKAAAELAKKFISGRFLPDKAIDLVDTCSGRISVNLGAKPAALEDCERQIQALEREKAALEREQQFSTETLDRARLDDIEQSLKETHEEETHLKTQWEAEHAIVKEILEIRDKLIAPPVAATDSAETTPPPNPKALKEQLKILETRLKEVQKEAPLIQYEVGEELVARIISDWTGVPLGKLLRDEASTMLQLHDKLHTSIRGQDQAITVISEGIKAAKAGLKLPDQPMGVFLLVGPSGVGKTETALALAELLFGGRDSLITINMSEFQEKHTVSRLIGSPPGYVGYGEGGMLTEAVRQRPYSVVLLDEVEKASLDVMNLFYQVFDKGSLSDGEGREINFKNTVLFLTSNLGSEAISDLCESETPPTAEQMTNAIFNELAQHFKPALLNRMSIVPYKTLSQEALKEIADMKMSKLCQRIESNGQFKLTYSDKVLDYIVGSCERGELGARNIDTIISRKIIPDLSATVLSSFNSNQKSLQEVLVDLKDDHQFTFSLKNAGPKPKKRKA